MSLLLLLAANVFLYFFFFFNDTATTEIYTLSLHDALPICQNTKDQVYAQNEMLAYQQKESTARVDKQASHFRSEERFSRNAETDLVCRLLLEKKKKQKTNTRH